MDPITLTLMAFGAAYYKRQAQRDRHAHELAQIQRPPVASSPVYTCAGCGNYANHHSHVTTCCGAVLCPNCYPQWLRAGGKYCVFCNTRHA